MISAFANSNGGKLFVGVDDNGNVVELKNMKQLLEDIPNTVRQKAGIVPSVESTRDGSIEITIQPSPVPVSYNGKFYLRSGSTVQELLGRELADFLSRKTGNSWEKVIEEQADLSSLEKETMDKFKNYAVDRIPSIREEMDTLTILKN